MIVTLVRELIGSVPSAGSNYDYSVLEYIVCAVVLIFMLSLVYRMIISIFGRN